MCKFVVIEYYMIIIINKMWINDFYFIFVLIYIIRIVGLLS